VHAVASGTATQEGQRRDRGRTTRPCQHGVQQRRRLGPRVRASRRTRAARPRPLGGEQLVYQHPVDVEAACSWRRESCLTSRITHCARIAVVGQLLDAFGREAASTDRSTLAACEQRQPGTWSRSVIGRRARRNRRSSARPGGHCRTRFIPEERVVSSSRPVQSARAGAASATAAPAEHCARCCQRRLFLQPGAPGNPRCRRGCRPAGRRRASGSGASAGGPLRRATVVSTPCSASVNRCPRQRGSSALSASAWYAPNSSSLTAGSPAHIGGHRRESCKGGMAIRLVAGRHEEGSFSSGLEAVISADATTQMLNLRCGGVQVARWSVHLRVGGVQRTTSHGSAPACRAGTPRTAASPVIVAPARAAACGVRGRGLAHPGAVAGRLRCAIRCAFARPCLDDGHRVRPSRRRRSRSGRGLVPRQVGIGRVTPAVAACGTDISTNRWRRSSLCAA